MNFLAFMPLLDPLTALYPNLSDAWLALVIPLIVIICIVYKTTREKELCKLPRAALVMSVQILILMALAAAALQGIYWLTIRVV